MALFNKSAWSQLTTIKTGPLFMKHNARLTETAVILIFLMALDVNLSILDPCDSV